MSATIATSAPGQPVLLSGGTRCQLPWLHQLLHWPASALLSAGATRCQLLWLHQLLVSQCCCPLGLLDVSCHGYISYWPASALLSAGATRCQLPRLHQLLHWPASALLSAGITRCQLPWPHQLLASQSCCPLVEGKGGGEGVSSTQTEVTQPEHVSTP